MPADLENAQQGATVEADSTEDSQAQPPSESTPQEQAAGDTSAQEQATGDTSSLEVTDSEAVSIEVAPAQSHTDPSKQHEKLQRLLSMRVPVIVKIAEKKMSIGNMLKFHMGSIIQFDKDAYQQLELMINNSTIGLGQPIKIGEKFGLRITQVGEITETIKSLSRHHVGPDT
jgi:flagellar motor switch protein FliN